MSARSGQVGKRSCRAISGQFFHGPKKSANTVDLFCLFSLVGHGPYSPGLGSCAGVINMSPFPSIAPMPNFIIFHDLVFPESQEIEFQFLESYPYRRVALCHAMPCHGFTCHAIFWRAVPCHILACHGVS